MREPLTPARSSRRHHEQRFTRAEAKEPDFETPSDWYEGHKFLKEQINNYLRLF